MMRVASLIAMGAFVFGLSWAHPSFAQDDRQSTKETRALMHTYAKCVVKQQGKKASQALLANVDNATILQNYKMLIVHDCLIREAATAEMRFGGDLYRYALADALVNAELALSAAPDLTAVPPLAHREPGDAPLAVTSSGKKIGKRRYDEAVMNHRQTAAYYFLSIYGECVVRRDPAAAKALLLAAADTSEEAMRFQALRSALGTCMPEGQTLRFGKVALRGTIAVNYYRLAYASNAVATKAGA